MQEVIWKSGIADFVQDLRDNWIIRILDDLNADAEFHGDEALDIDEMDMDEVRYDIVYTVRESDKAVVEYMCSTHIISDRSDIRKGDRYFLSQFPKSEYSSVTDALEYVTTFTEIGKIIIAVDQEKGQLGIYMDGQPYAGFLIDFNESIDTFQEYVVPFDENFVRLWYLI